jgi:Transcription factor WhiB
MKKHDWKESASCLDYDTNIFFDKYEEDLDLRVAVDDLCSKCEVRKQCFAVGVSGKEWGVWGGVFLDTGSISKEFNSHKSKQAWANVWQSLTMDQT